MPFVVLLHIPKGHIKKQILEKHQRNWRDLFSLFCKTQSSLQTGSRPPPHLSSPNQPTCGMPVTELHLVSVELGLEGHKELVVLLGKSEGFFFNENQFLVVVTLRSRGSGSGSAGAQWQRLHAPSAILCTNRTGGIQDHEDIRPATYFQYSPYVLQASANLEKRRAPQNHFHQIPAVMMQLTFSCAEHSAGTREKTTEGHSKWIKCVLSTPLRTQFSFLPIKLIC